MTHYSPELVRYIQGAAHPAELTQASDIFALGLIYTEYLTGSLPPFDPSHPQAAIAVLHGERLRVATDRVPEEVRNLVERMMLHDPAGRPTVAEVHGTLMGIRTTRSTPGRFPSPLGRRSPNVPPRPRRQGRRQWHHPSGHSCAAGASASPEGRPQPPRPPQPTLPRTCRRPLRPPQRIAAAALDCSAGWSPASTSGARDDRSHPCVALRSLRDRQWRRHDVRRVRCRDDPPLPRGQRGARPDRAVAAAATTPPELPPPVQRAINREPVDQEEWPYDDQRFRMVPVPGGCIMVSTPRRRDPGGW